jgi:hypothetical protein
VPDCEDERIMPGTARDEAAVQADLVTQDRARLAQIESAVGPSPSAWIAPNLRHARAVLADDDEAAECFPAAFEADLSRLPYQRARPLLAQGRWLRRRRAITDSRGPLRAARDGFGALGCAAWADQARRNCAPPSDTPAYGGPVITMQLADTTTGRRPTSSDA